MDFSQTVLTTSFLILNWANIPIFIKLCIKIDIYEYFPFRWANLICPSSDWWDKLLLLFVVENMWFVVIISGWHERRWKSFTKPVDSVTNQFPVKINPYRDKGKYYEIDQSLPIMSKLSLLTNSVERSQLTRGTKVFSTDDCKDIFSALCQLKEIGTMSVPL